MAEKDTAPQPAGNQNHGGHGGFQGVVEKPHNFWGTTKRLLDYMQDRLVGLILVLAFAIISVIFQIRTPKILGEATTEIFKGLMKEMPNKKPALAWLHFRLTIKRLSKLFSSFL